MKPIAAGLLAVFGAAAGLAHAQTTSVITRDGKTPGTSIDHHGNVFDIKTTVTSSKGKTAFNSFSRFEEASGDTVNLFLPGASTNLVNLVWDAKAQINGTLNSFLANNASKPGGNVYFADPHGIVVGSDAHLNVGALSLSAPTTDFMDSLLDGDTVNPDAAGFATLLEGTEPLAQSSVTGASGCEDYLICVAGTITAQNAVRIHATSIDVSGTIFVEGDGASLLGSAVNLDGSDATTVVHDGNTIRLIAVDSDTAAMGDATAATAVNVNGTLKTGTVQVTQPDASAASADSWGLVQVVAHSAATSSFETPDSTSGKLALATQQAGDLFKDQDSLFENGFKDAAVDANLAAGDKLGLVAYVRASATANVTVSGTIDAAGDVVLGSATHTDASTQATAEASDGTIPVMVGAMYGAVYSKADTRVASGADVTAAEAVRVTADTDNELDVSAETVTAEQPLNTTVAWSQAVVTANADVDGALHGKAVDVLAHNSNRFATEARARTSAKSGAVGIAAAVSEQTVTATAALNASPDITATSGAGSGNVTVAAGTRTDENRTAADTDTGAPSETSEDRDKTGTTNASLGDTLANKSNSGLNKDGSKSRKALPFHVGAAVAYTDSSNTSSASIGANVNIDTPGNVTVYSSNVDEGVHGGAESKAVTKAKEGGSTKADIAAAVNYANYVHNAGASVGEGAIITAAHIGVGSNLEMPFDWTFGLGEAKSTIDKMFDSADDFFAGLGALKDLGSAGADQITGNVSGFAGAEAGESTGVAIGGSVNYFAVTNTNRAWIGDGAQLTSTVAATDPDTWQSHVEWRSDPVDWEHAVSVVADTALTAFNLVGTIRPWKTGTEGGKAAIGGAFNYGGYNTTTLAGVGSGALVTSNNGVGVDATSKDTLIVLSPISGKGGSVGLQGTVALSDVKDTTHATVSAAATVNADDLDIAADNPLMIWSFSGALAMSSKASIGLSVGINHIHTDTVASIGDNSADDPLTTSSFTPAETGGKVTAAAVSLQALSSGEAGTLSVAGASTSSSSGGDGGGGGTKKKPGKKLLGLIESVKSVTDTLHDGLDAVDAISGAVDSSGNDNSGPADGDSLLDKAGTILDDISSASDAASSAGAGLSKLIGEAGSTSQKHGGAATPTNAGRKAGSFGIGISGAAGVNLASLGSSATLQNADIQIVDGGAGITLRGINRAALTSVAGAAALQRAKTSGFSGALAGAVAYSSVADSTLATVTGSTLTDANNVTLQALDGSQQLDIGIGAAINTAKSKSVTVAGSVSIAKSANTTAAKIDGGSTVDGGAANADANILDITAYDHSSIGVGGGSLYASTSNGTSGNAGLGFAWADIANTTSVKLDGHTGDADARAVSHFHALTMQALDASLIAAGALAGGFSSSKQSLNLAGAIIWNRIGNTTSADITGGMRLAVGDGGITVAASASAPDASLDALIGQRPDAEGYDFAGDDLGTPATKPTPGEAPGDAGNPAQPGADALDFASNGTGPGSSIIAVAGTLQVGGNNVGVSYVGNKVTNTHRVNIGSASLDTTGAVKLTAADGTRIIGLAVGAAVSTGKFAGVGSATTNEIGNKVQVLIGSAVDAADTGDVTAASVNAKASDTSHIYSLAGNVAIGTGAAAAGGALTYNDIANTVTAHAGATHFDVTNGNVNLSADEQAQVMAGAVAAAGANKLALSLSLGWNQTGNTVNATLDDGSVVDAGSLDVDATDASTIYTLAGGVAIGGKGAVGLAGAVADIDDTATASVQDVGLDVVDGNTGGAGDTGAINVDATTAGTQYALSVAGTFGGQAGGAGSATVNLISDSAAATVSNIYGVTHDAGDTSAAAVAQSLTVDAEDNAGIYSLAGGLGLGGSVGVGAAASINDIGGSTTASLSDAVLDVADATTITAVSGATIDTAAVAGSVGSEAAVSASDTTNTIHNTIAAGMANVGTANGASSASNHYAVDSRNITTISAQNNATINSLAGAVGGSGSVAVGAAVAVNDIGTTTAAGFLGGADNRLYEAKSFLIRADTDGAHINTIAVGASGGGDAAVAGSVAVNLMDGSTTAKIAAGADIVASDNAAVLASNSQGINVLAGAAAIGGTAGVGVGVMVNKIDSSTTAGIYHSQLTAYGAGDALGVDSGTLADPAALRTSVNITDPDQQPAFVSDPTAYVAPDLSDTQAQVHGIAVNASNQQNIATLGLGASVAASVSVNGLVGVNDVGGTTTATVQGSSLNQADYVAPSKDGKVSSAGGSVHADDDQQVDVRASSRQYEANLVANAAGSGTVAVDGAAATNVFDGTTTASVVDTDARSRSASTVAASGSQWSLSAAMGAAISGEVSVAASAAVTMFKSHTDALVDGGSFNANGTLSVLADNATHGSLLGGSIGFGAGTAGIAGVALVNIDNAETSAIVQNGAMLHTLGDIDVKATSSNAAQGVALAGAAGLYAGVAGGAAVNVIADSTHATVAGSTLTARNVAVQALDTQSLNVYSGQFGGGLVGVGGGINLSLLQASVGASALDSTISADDAVIVGASSIRNVTSVAASAGVGAVGVGLSAGVIVAGTGNIGDTSDGNDGKVDTEGSLNAGGQVNMGGLAGVSGSDRVDPDGNYGLDSTQLSSSDVSEINQDGAYDLSDSTGTGAAAFGASDGVTATVSGGTVTAHGTVAVNAGVTNSTRNTAGGFSAGAVAVGGSVAYTSLNTTIDANVAPGTTVNAGDVSISATSGDAGSGPAASTNAIAGSGGLVAVDAAVAVSRINNTVTATNAGTLNGTGGDVSIAATDSASASAGNSNASGVTVGFIAAGTVVVDALRTSHVTASIASGASVNNFDTAEVVATDAGAVTAQGVMGVGGVSAAISGVVANAGDTSTVLGSIGGGASVNVGDTTLSAVAKPTVSATAKGIAVAGVAGIGANVALAHLGADVTAWAADGADFDGSGNLAVLASLTPTVSATTSGGAGAALVGLNAAVAKAADSGTLLAGIANGAALPDGNVTILAASSTRQTSSAKSITKAGLVAAGAADATSTSNVTTVASLGDGDGSATDTTGNLTISATGQDVNDAHATAGSGGLAAGNAALATTNSTSTTSATAGRNLDLAALQNFSLLASHKAIYGGAADSSNAAAVGASGANVHNTATSTTTTSIGANSTIKAHKGVHVEARSTFASDANNAGAIGGAGGIAVGTAAGVHTTLTATNNTLIGDDVVLAAAQDPQFASTAALVVLADTRTDGVGDKASLGGYGLAADANAVVGLTGDFTSHVTVGDGSRLTSNGRLDIATYAQLQKIGNSASATAGGVGALGTADATVDLTSNQFVTIGGNVALGSVGEADVIAGRDVLFSADTELHPSAVAQAFVRALVAIPEASASASATSNATLTMGSGSSLTSGGDVAVGSTSGTNRAQADGTGHGFEIGLIPVTRHDSDQSSGGSAQTLLNGSVMAGKYSTIDIHIDKDGKVTAGSDNSSPFTYLKYNADCSAANGATGECFNPTTYYNRVTGVNMGSTYNGWDNKNVGAIIIGGVIVKRNGVPHGTDLLVSGGNAYVFGSRVTGDGSITANGAPSITITNESPDYLILPGMNVGFGSTGSVIVSGGADPDLPGIAVSQSPSGSAPSINVDSSYPANGTARPGIAWLGDINNLGGSVTIKTAAGSLLEAPIHANKVTVAAPNGGITFNHPKQNWASGNSSQSALTPGSWLTGFLVFTLNPDWAAAVIANSVYGKQTPVPPGWIFSDAAWNVVSLNSDLMNYNVAQTSAETEQTPVVMYGYCEPYTNDGADGCGTDAGFGATTILDGREVDTVPYFALTQSGNFPAYVAASSGSYTSQTLSVTANYININSPVYVGTPASWSVTTSPALTGWMDSQHGSNPVAIPDNLLVASGGTQRVGASYNPSTGQIIVDDVNAIGGGKAVFHGKVVSTGHGSIHVNSGFGKVFVDNQSGHPLVVNNVYTGNAGLGLIEFDDRLQHKTTWYVSQDGNPANVYVSTSGATSWRDATEVGAVTAGMSYQPKPGEEFTWTASSTVNRRGGQSHWSWGSYGSGSVGQHWSIDDSSVRYVDPGDSGHKDLNGKDYLATLSGDFTHSTYGRVWYHGCGDDKGSDCHYGTSATAYSDDQDSWHSEWDYIFPTEGTLSLTFTQRADLPIGIAFTTSAQNHVEIDSNADILLKGVISNTNGVNSGGQPVTELHATDGGDILQAAPDALIWTHGLAVSVSGGGNIGTIDAPVATRIVHDTSPGSVVLASADGGSIAIDVDSGTNDQQVNVVSRHLASGVPDRYGDIQLTTTGNLVGMPGKSRDIIGGSVNLASTIGGIGSAATPLAIEAHPTSLYNGAITGGALNAHAQGDIYLNDFGGDLWVGTITSATGDVSLTAMDGGIYDVRNLAPATTLTQTQAQRIWSRLGLDSTAGADTVANALENQVDAAYRQYWQLLGAGTVSGGSYTLDTKAIQIYWPLAAAVNQLDASAPPDLAVTRAYAASLYTTDTQLFAKYLGGDWSSSAGFDQQQSGWKFVIDKSSSLYQSLVDGMQWSHDQLRYAINTAALAQPSGGQVGYVPPNISARNVTLDANNGGIGRTVAPVSIDYQNFVDLYKTGNASPELQNDVTVLGMANVPGDVVLLDKDGQALLPTDPDFASRLATISVAQTNPLYITASGSVSGSASGSVYIQADGDLHLAGLRSGDGDAMRLAATGAIHAASGSTFTDPVLTAGGNLVISAGGGSVSFGDGDASDPGHLLPVQIAGTLLSGSATGNFMLGQLQGDLDIGSIYGGGVVWLQSPRSILGALDQLSITGHDIRLNAGSDSTDGIHGLAGASTPLELTVGADGVLNATAGGAVNIESPHYDLHVGSITSGGNLTLTATVAGLDAQTLTSTAGAVVASAGGNATFANVDAAGGATLAAAGSLQAGSVDSHAGDILVGAVTGMSIHSLHAEAGNVSALTGGSTTSQLVLTKDGSVFASGNIRFDAGDSLTMRQGSRMQAGGEVALNSVGDMILGSVHSDAADGTAIAVDAGGAMAGNGAAINLQARQGGAVSLQATNDIGAVALPLVVDVNQLSGESKTGSLWLRAVGDIAIADYRTPDGNFAIAADDALNAATLAAGGNATLESGGDMTLGTVTTGSVLKANAGHALDAATLAAGGNATLESGSDMTLGTVTTGGDLDATSGHNLAATTLDIGRDGDLEAAGAVALLGQVKARHDLELLAQGRLGFAGITAGNDVTGESRADGIDGDTVNAGDSIRFIAAKSIHIKAQTAGADITLQAGDDVATGSVVADHDVHVTAGRNVQIDTARAGNLIAVHAGGKLSIKTADAGRATSLSAQRMDFTRLTAPDSISLLATGGDITGATLTTRDADIAASGHIALGTANIGNRITLAATDITAHVKQTSTDQPLHSTLTGYRNGVATQITVDVDAPDQWLIDRVAAVNAALRATAPRVDIASGHIEKSMLLTTSKARVWMDQQDPTLVPADVQLMQPTADFLLKQDGIHTLSDAFVIRFDYGYQIQTPNYAASHTWMDPDYFGGSAFRFYGRLTSLHTKGQWHPNRTPRIPDWLTAPPNPTVRAVGKQAAVNLGSPK